MTAPTCEYMQMEGPSRRDACRGMAAYTEFDTYHLVKLHAITHACMQKSNYSTIVAIISPLHFCPGTKTKYNTVCTEIFALRNFREFHESVGICRNFI